MHFNGKCLICALAFIFNIYLHVTLAQDTQILASGWYNLLLADENGERFEVIAESDMYAIGHIAYHETKNYIFWTRWFGNITRFHYPSADNHTEVIVLQDGYSAYGITVDSINDYLYWSNSSDETIVRSNLDGTEITIILDFSRNGYVGILEVDSEKGYISFISYRH